MHIHTFQQIVKKTATKIAGDGHVLANIEEDRDLEAANVRNDDVADQGKFFTINKYF